ncbi:hypothetical protein GJ496_005407 [Pomphorhynchus laevis]|nr:hypothetical protein GJ496_005407 [Pomphorhynchus laevis]
MDNQSAENSIISNDTGSSKNLSIIDYAQRQAELITANETPWQRLNRYYRKSEFSIHRRKDNEFILSSTCTCALVGYIVGASLQSESTELILERSKALTKFTSVYRAKRFFFDYKVYRNIRGGSKVALQFGIIAYGILNIGVMCDVLLNKSTPIGYSFGSAFMFGLRRCTSGIMPFVASCVYGVIYGGMLGSVYSGLRWIVDESQSDRNVRFLKEAIIKDLTIKNWGKPL